MTTPEIASKLKHHVRGALPRGGRAVLAVSGGLDSMVLLDVAARVARGFRCALMVATFDHASGAHSARAAAFVCTRATAYGLPVVIGRAETPARTEAAWRAARWEFLRSVGLATVGVILTAHTRDDQVETVLMRVFRNAGARGLAGLLAPSEVRRPLLQASRAELTEYAREHGIAWVADPTNRSPRYLRNRVRRDLLPALREVRPSFDDDLLDLSIRAAQWRRELSELVDRHILFAVGKDGRGARTLEVASEDLAGYSARMLGVVWPELAARAGVTLDARGTRRAAEFTISSRTGGRIQLSGGWELIRSRGSFELRPMDEVGTLESDARPLRPATTWDRWTFRVDQREAGRDPWCASLPGGNDLQVRAWRPGDRLTISHRGRLIARKVKYFLTDAGISGHIRRRWPVVVAGDEVVWIPGVRRSDAATERSGRPVVTYVCDYLDRRS